MSWLGLVVGVLVGAVLWKVPGALALGFLGWLVGFIIAANRKPVVPVKTGTQRPERSVAPDSIVARLDAIEARLALIEEFVRMPEAPPEPAATVVPAAPPPTPQPRPMMAAPSEPLTPGEMAALTPAPARKVLEPPPPPPPREPAPPNPIVAWFLGGNTIVRVGLLILFFGLGFLVKYGVEHQMIPVELRVAGVGAAGLALLIVGWRLRHKREGYALSLQGAGVAVLYLTIFGSLKLYGLIPPGMAFALLVVIAALSAFLAVKQDSLVFAVFAAAGGFLAPILASTGQGSHVMLFSYYLLLNASIVAIAWFKAWRALNLVGFVFTVLIGTAWGVRSYRPEYFDTTEPFLGAFFLMYVAIAILFARKASETSERYVDASIVFGAPIFAFGLQAALMRGTEFGLAFTSAGAAALYLGLASALRKRGDRYRLLFECFLALGVVFATLAIPLALDARWTSAAWALEGAAIVWVGLRQGRKVARAFGLLLELGAGVAFFNAYPTMPPGPPFADALFVGAIVMFATGVFTYRLLARPEADTAAERALSPFAFIWSIAWLVVAGGHEIETFVPREYRIAVWVAFIAAIPLAFGLVAMRRGWEEAKWPALVLAPLLLVFAGIGLLAHAHPFANGGWLAWPFAIVVSFFVLAKLDLRDDGWTRVLHVLSVAVVAAIGALELEWLATEHTAPGTAWALASRIVAPSIILLAISSRWAEHRWPVRDLPIVYRIGAVATLVVAMALWSLHVNISHAGGSDPLPYIPLLNALDLAHVLAALAITAAILAARRSGLAPPAFLTPKVAIAVAGVVGFVWANSMLLRTIHHWAGVAYQPHALWHSVLVQASLSVFWAFLALSLMVFATRRGMRVVWMIGAALMGVVIAKLVAIDLGNLAGIERIVSFIGVGVLMLVIGYFSPVPPRKVEAA